MNHKIYIKVHLQYSTEPCKEGFYGIPMAKNGNERRYPPQFGHWHGAPTPHICTIGNSLEESETHAAALAALRKEYQDAPLRRAEPPSERR
jgi:hypothetical protein